MKTGIELRRAFVQDKEILWKMQKEAFAELLARYEDYDMSPGNESLERVEEKLSQPFTYFYWIMAENEAVGAIRVVDMKDGSRKKISPLFIMPQHRSRGYAQAAMAEAERLHGADNWKLGTILEEAGNCYLYEKIGYRKTGQTEKINDKMTIVYYEKN